jgi:hypothetical protein
MIGIFGIAANIGKNVVNWSFNTNPSHERYLAENRINARSTAVGFKYGKHGGK